MELSRKKEPYKIGTFPRFFQFGDLLITFHGKKFYIYRDAKIIHEYESSSVDIRSLSVNQKYLAISLVNKTILVFDKKNNSFEKCFTSTKLRKNISEIRFDSTNNNLLFIALLNGEVFEFDVNKNSLTLKLGHISAITDMKFSPNGKFLCTAIRDEKIRVSMYPKTYLIHNFLMGHDNMVTRMAFWSDQLLVSGGADGCLKLWKIDEEGSEEDGGKCCLDTFKTDDVVQDIDCDAKLGLLSVIYENENRVHLFTVVEKKFCEKEIIIVDEKALTSKIVKSNDGKVFVFVLKEKGDNLSIFEFKDWKAEKTAIEFKFDPYVFVPNERTIYSSWKRFKKKEED